MKHVFFILLALLLSLSLDAAVRPRLLGDALSALDRAVSSRDDYRRLRDNRLEQLKLRLVNASSRDSVALLTNIAASSADMDSAASYVAVLYSVGHPSARPAAVLTYSDILISGMLFSDALKTLDELSPDSLGSVELTHFYSSKSRALMGVASTQPSRRAAANARRAAIVALDSLNARFSPHGVASRMTYAQREYLKGNYALGAGELAEIIDSLDIETPSFAIAAGMLAQYFRDNPARREEYLYYLSLSALSDVLNANPEPQSLIQLAGESFNDGDIDRAYSYLSAAQDMIDRNHPSGVSSMLVNPLIAINDNVKDRERHNRSVFMCVLACLLLLSLAALLLLLAERRRTRNLRSEISAMSDSLSARELYISQLLSICSVYIEGMEDFNKLVARKLKVGQTKDVLDMIESGRMLQEQSERFFNAFDAAVLRIYPDFTAELNRLLMPDKQLAQPGPDKLSPEQRIVAFMRLGVIDSARIAKFLGLSLNTIYTYRNRVKNRALDRDNFEYNVASIGKNV